MLPKPKQEATTPRKTVSMASYRTMTWVEFWRTLREDPGRQGNVKLQKILAFQETYQPRDLNPDLVEAMASRKIKAPVSFLCSRFNVFEGNQVVVAEGILTETVKQPQPQLPLSEPKQAESEEAEPAIKEPEPVATTQAKPKTRPQPKKNDTPDNSEPLASTESAEQLFSMVAKATEETHEPILNVHKTRRSARSLASEQPIPEFRPREHRTDHTTDLASTVGVRGGSLGTRNDHAVQRVTGLRGTDSTSARLVLQQTLNNLPMYVGVGPGTDADRSDHGL